MATSPDTTTSPRSFCKTSWMEREDEEGPERCGWITSETSSLFPPDILLSMVDANFMNILFES